MPAARLRSGLLCIWSGWAAITDYVMFLQDGISKLQNLEVLEIVGASSLRVEPGIGQLPNLMSLEFNSCE